MAKQCHVDGCGRSVLPALAAEGVCLDHFVELVIQRTEQVRGQCVKAQPVDEDLLDWLLADAPHAAHALSAGETGNGPADIDKVLELLLCLANLHDYIAHHSLRVKRIH